MTEPAWLPLKLKTDKIAAKPDALWTLVGEYIKGPMKLKIEATGTWEYSQTNGCGPDGSRQAGFLADALNPSAPLGTLIGKLAEVPPTNLPHRLWPEATLSSRWTTRRRARCFSR